MVTDPVSLKPFGMELEYFTCTEIYTKAIQACKVSEVPSSLNMCKIPKALRKNLILLPLATLKFLYSCIKMLIML